MIKLDIATLIFTYMALSVALIVVVGVVFGRRKIRRRRERPSDYIWKCSVCLNDYIDSKNEEMSICPVCGSYNKKEGVKI